MSDNYRPKRPDICEQTRFSHQKKTTVLRRGWVHICTGSNLALWGVATSLCYSPYGLGVTRSATPELHPSLMLIRQDTRVFELPVPLMPESSQTNLSFATRNKTLSRMRPTVRISPAPATSQCEPTVCLNKYRRKPVNRSTTNLYHLRCERLANL
jgi:hypothetical protein